VAVLLAGHQLFLLQSVIRGESPGERLLIPSLVPRFESVLGKDAMLDPQTRDAALVAGGIVAGVGFLGLVVMGLQDSARARKAARLVVPPTFDDRDTVSSHHFVAEGLEGRARMIRFWSILAFLPIPFAPVGIYAAVIHGQWLTALVLLGATAAFVTLGVFLWRGDKDRYLKNGVERIDVMTGGLRWVRHGDPTVRAVAWSQISGCQSFDDSGHPWNHFTMVTLRTGEKIRLPKCCLTDYTTCVDLVKQGRKEGGLRPGHRGVAGLATAFLLSR
jgi:hypothetical protein